VLIPDFPIRGYEFYDYRDEIVNPTFVNYQDNDLRKTGALSWLLFTSSGVSTASSVEGAEFVNAKPVYFPNIDPRFDNDNRGGAGYRTLSIYDIDGSVTGVADSHVLLHDGENNSVVTDDSCAIHADWNASVCTGDIGRLNLSTDKGELPGNLDISTRSRRIALVAAAVGRRPPAPDAPPPPPIAPPAPQKPIALIRNGTEFRITGNLSNVKSGTQMEVKTERQEVTLSLAEMDQHAWVIFELPGFASAASGTRQGSMDALRAAKETSWFRDEDGLWVKLVVTEPPIVPVRGLDLQASITVNR
jgi:cell migration-inducing and hyaluronan-binding protein